MVFFRCKILDGKSNYDDVQLQNTYPIQRTTAAYPEYREVSGHSVYFR